MKYKTSEAQWNKLYNNYNRERFKEESTGNYLYGEQLSLNEFKDIYIGLKNSGVKNPYAEVIKQERIVSYSEAVRILQALGEEVSRKAVYAITSGERWEDFVGVHVNQDWAWQYRQNYDYNRSRMQAFYAWLAQLGILSTLGGHSGDNGYI